MQGSCRFHFSFDLFLKVEVLLIVFIVWPIVKVVLAVKLAIIALVHVFILFHYRIIYFFDGRRVKIIDNMATLKYGMDLALMMQHEIALPCQTRCA